MIFSGVQKSLCDNTIGLNIMFVCVSEREQKAAVRNITLLLPIHTFSPQFFFLCK